MIQTSLRKSGIANKQASEPLTLNTERIKMSRTPGKFIVIEGGDFCGKTTFAAQLERVLLYRGLSLNQLRLPGGDPQGEQIRKVLVGTELNALARAYLFAANRSHLSDHVLKPLLKLGQGFICTRWKWSSNVYQGYDRLTNQIDLLTDVVNPDLYILLECTDEVMKMGLEAKKKLGDPITGDEVDLMDEENTKNYLEIKERYQHEYDVHGGDKFKFIYNEGLSVPTDKEFIEKFKPVLDWLGYFEHPQVIDFPNET